MSGINDRRVIFIVQLVTALLIFMGPDSSWS